MWAWAKLTTWRWWYQTANWRRSSMYVSRVKSVYEARNPGQRELFGSSTTGYESQCHMNVPWIPGEQLGNLLAATLSAANGTYNLVGLQPSARSYAVCFDATFATGGSSKNGYADQCYSRSDEPAQPQRPDPRPARRPKTTRASVLVPGQRAAAWRATRGTQAPQDHLRPPHLARVPPRGKARR
jgi:hypothetical protein